MCSSDLKTVSRKIFDDERCVEENTRIDGILCYVFVEDVFVACRRGVGDTCVGFRSTRGRAVDDVCPVTPGADHYASSVTPETSH